MIWRCNTWRRHCNTSNTLLQGFQNQCRVHCSPPTSWVPKTLCHCTVFLPLGPTVILFLLRWKAYIWICLRKNTKLKTRQVAMSPILLYGNNWVFFFPYAPTLEHRANFSVSWLFTDGRTPWTGDQLVARSLPKHRKRIHTSNIHALNGIRTHDLGFRTSEDSTCLRPLDYSDRQMKQNIWRRFIFKNMT
jgi:hypothetical protein